MREKREENNLGFLFLITIIYIKKSVKYKNALMQRHIQLNKNQYRRLFLNPKIGTDY